MKVIAGDLTPDEGHEKFAEMVPPFTKVDREGDYREAWRHFEGMRQAAHPVRDGDMGRAEG